MEVSIMLRKVILLVCTITGLVSCSKEKITYDSLIFRDNNVKMWPQTLPENWKDVIENGEFTVDDESGNIIAEGKFMRGLRVGQWTYHPSDTQVVKIDWNKYEKQGGSVLMNYPKDWEIIEADERPFQASFPLKEGENEKGKYFIILSHNKDSIEMNLERYFSYYQSRMFDTEKITEYAFFEFKTAANKSFYFSRYVIERNGEEILAFSFLGEIGPTIYDITYSSLNEDISKKHIIFFDMIRSLVLERKRFFSPFDPVKGFRPIEKPKKVEKSQPPHPPPLPVFFTGNFVGHI